VYLLKKPLFVFLPDDNIKTTWDVLIALVLSISVFVLPFCIAFLEWRMPSSAQDCQGMREEYKCEVVIGTLQRADVNCLNFGTRCCT
jgi:hypothetical protein